MKTIEQITDEVRTVITSIKGRRTSLKTLDSEFEDTEENELLGEALEYATLCESTLENI